MDSTRDHQNGTPTAVPAARALVDGIGTQTAITRTAAAARFELIDRLRLVTEAETGASWCSPDGLAWRDLRAEIAAVLTVHERSAQNLLDLARRLVHDFPNTLDGLRDAAFPESHARILVDESAGLSPELLVTYEDRLLPSAAELIAPRFAKLAREVRAALQPEALIERHQEALATRRTALEAAPDGMAWYGALLSAEDAVGAAAAVTGLARALKVGGETRTMAQLEADVFRDLMIDTVGVAPAGEAGAAPVASPAARRGVRAEVLVHVPVLTAIGRSDDGALLDGYGPIDADTARALCADAPGFLRVLTDPADGAVLSFGRTTYRVPAELKRFLRVRDEVCRFVGCTRSATLCDIDPPSAQAWAEGPRPLAGRRRNRRGEPRPPVPRSPPGQGATTVADRARSRRDDSVDIPDRAHLRDETRQAKVPAEGRCAAETDGRVVAPRYG